MPGPHIHVRKTDPRFREIKKAKENSHAEGSPELIALRRLLSEVGELEGMPGEGDPELIQAAGLIAQRLDDMEGTIDDHNEQLSSLGDIGAETTSKEQKIAAIVQFGQNQRGGKQKWNITAKDIIGVTGVSRRYAYDLIENIADEYEWAVVREPRTQDSAKDGGERKIRWKKAVQIDFEALHGDQESVNKFTTGMEVSADS